MLHMIRRLPTTGLSRSSERTLTPRGRLGRNDVALAWPATLAFRQLCFKFLRFCWLFPRRDRGRIARDVTHEMVAEHPLHQGRVDTLRHATRRQFSERPRECRFARHLRGALPTDQPAQDQIDVQPLDQCRRGRHVQHSLGDERARQRMPVVERPAGTAVAHPDVGLDARHLQHRNEPLVIVRERPDLRLKPREKLALNMAPTACYSFSKRHVPSDSLVVVRNNTMPKTNRDASIFPSRTKKFYAPTLFCKWLMINEFTAVPKSRPR